eukprot:901665-Pyramimonas_sp.AAC.1
MEQNWGAIQDPWEARGINNEEEDMSGVETGLFYDGSFLLTPVVRMWGRFALNMPMRLRVSADTRFLSIVAPRAKNLSSDPITGECPHQAECIWHGSNQCG